MSKIIITADSTCDLSPELVEKYGIVILPLIVNMGESSYYDGVDIHPSDIFSFVNEKGILPKTSARMVGEYEDVFAKYHNDGFDIVHISIGSALSSSYNNACFAAEEFDNVFVVDSANLSTGSGHLVIEAKIMADNGMEASEIAAKLNDLAKKVDASFVVDNLEYLHKGGRCSAVAKLGANILKLKPLIQVTDGKMGVAKKYRGNLKDVIKQYVNDKLSAPGVKFKNDRIFITTTCTPDSELIQIAKAEIEKTGLFTEILHTTAGCTITSHCGENVLGILFITE